MFEKEVVWCDKREMQKTGLKCEYVTQVVWRVTSYDDEERKKKVLTPVLEYLQMSNGKGGEMLPLFGRATF